MVNYHHYRLWLPRDPPKNVYGLTVRCVIRQTPGARNILIRKWVGREIEVKTSFQIPRPDAVTVEFALRGEDGVIRWRQITPEKVEQAPNEW